MQVSTGRVEPLQAAAAAVATVAEKHALNGYDANDSCTAWLWKQRIRYGDQYCLQWESSVLQRYGKCLHTFTQKMLMGYARGEVVKYTVFSALFAAMALPTLVISACNMIDSEWTMAMNRADTCGKLLAKALLQREQGMRPVSLIGYGMGARLIFSCLKQLAKVRQSF
jgi:hypothetical protein